MHLASVVIYWICTICMLLECFILFVKAVTPSGLEFPDEYSYLRSQEIVLFVLASLQLFVMSMGVAYRVQLSQNYAHKTIWALSAFVLSVLSFGINVKNLKVTRQLIIFIFAMIQACAAAAIYWTCYRLRKLVKDFHAEKNQRSVGTSVL